MAISSGLAKRRIIKKGIDERNLGRWSWIKFQGKMNRTVRFISARQCGSNVGPSTIFSQQRSYSDKEGDNRHPREMFQKEMCELLNKWKNEGDVIVMSVDANEHATTGESSFKLHQLGLVEVITTKHEESSGIAPTYHGGQDPIDGIFVSSNVNIVQAGCRPFGEAPSDHRALWFKCKFNEIFGCLPQRCPPMVLRRVQCKNPRVVKRFNESCHQFLLNHKMCSRAHNIQSQIQQGLWNDNVMQEHEELRKLRIEGILEADSKCRNIKNGRSTME